MKIEAVFFMILVYSVCLGGFICALFLASKRR